MKIGRKIYYNKTTGYIILTTGECQGDVTETSLEQDVEYFQPLKEIVLEDIACIKLEHGEYANLTPILINKDTLDIQWSNNTIIGNEPIQLSNIDALRQTKIQEMSEACEYYIINNFYSTCLGEPHKFDCDRDDQSYMLGLTLKAPMIEMLQLNGMDTRLNWKFTGEAKCYPFTPQQVIALGVDLCAHLTDSKEHYQDLRAYILEEGRTIEELNEVVWGK